MQDEYTAHELTREGFKLVVVPDDDPCMGNPYHEYDLLTDCVTWMRDYDFDSIKGRYKPYDGPDDVVAAYNTGDLVYYAPLYAYIHSGITVNLGSMGNWPDQQWDCGLAGMVYVTREKAHEVFGKAHFDKNGRVRSKAKLRAACKKIAECEVKILDDWLTNNIWGYKITDPDGEEVGSCWGFLGDSEYCFEEAKTNLDYYVRKHLSRGV
jgi:hypothetical protein